MQLPEPKMTSCQLNPLEQILVKFWSKYNTFYIHEIVFENIVCELVVIFFFPGGGGGGGGELTEAIFENGWIYRWIAMLRFCGIN